MDYVLTNLWVPLITIVSAIGGGFWWLFNLKKEIDLIHQHLNVNSKEREREFKDLESSLKIEIEYLRSQRSEDRHQEERRWGEVVRMFEEVRNDIKGLIRGQK